MLLGRLCLSSIFIFSFLHKVVNWDESFFFLKKSLSLWTVYLSNYWEGYQVNIFIDYLGEFSPLLLLLAMIFEGLGSVLVVSGIKVRAGAFLLILFLIGATLIGHPFWLMPKSEKEFQMIMFFKNIAILGGLFTLFACAGKKKREIEE